MTTVSGARAPLPSGDATTEPPARRAPPLLRSLRLASLPALASVLLACVPYVEKPVDTVRSADAYRARRLDDPRVLAAVRASRPEHADPWPPRQWDRADLLLAALALNPALAEQRAALATVRAGLATARARPEPAIGLLSEYSSRAGGSSPWLLGVALDLPLDLGARRAARVGAAEALEQQALFDAAERIWSVRDALVRALDDAELAQRRIAVLRERVADRDRELRGIERRVTLGEAARPDLTRIEAEALADRQRLAETQREEADARSRLAAAIGVPNTALDGVVVTPGAPEPLRAFDDARLDSMQEQALLARADLRRAIAGYALAEQQLRLEIARQYPEVRLGPGYTWERGVVKLPFNLSLALPLLARNRGPIAEAEARREEAGRHLEAVQAGIQAEVDRARSQYRLALAALAEVRSGPLEVARRIESAAAAQLEAGALDQISMIEARMGRRAAELALVSAQADARRAEADLETALRQPLEGAELTLARPLVATSLPETRP